MNDTQTQYSFKQRAVLHFCALGLEIGGDVLEEDSIDGFNFGVHVKDQKNRASLKAPKLQQAG